MHFAFMGRILQYDGFGMNTLLEGILRGILSLKTKHKITLLIEPGQIIPWIGDHINIIQIPPRPKSYLTKMIWDHISVGRICRSLKIDALYSPAHIKPLYSPIPVVVSVLDMMYHLFPEYWMVIERLYFQWAVKLLTTHASAISILSESTRKDLLNLYPQMSKKLLEVIYPGVPYGFQQLPTIDSYTIRTKYQLFNPYILYVGGFHPRKNLAGILDAFSDIHSDLPHHLVLVGPKAWESKKIVDRINHISLSNKVHYLGLVPRSDLPLLYNQADIFVFPSLYEGFGFPVLEAMACGCPTITSKISSLTEVGGNAVIYIDPFNRNSLIEAINSLAFDHQKKDELKFKGLQQARHFSWISTAQKTLLLMEQAAELE
jgi:glycosyltransferase involved in cell wall biosynthesis